MAAVAFDTLKFSRSLREKAHLSAEQAEGFADALSEAIQNDIATKGDLERVQNVLRADVEKLRVETKADGEKIRSDLSAEIGKVRSDLSAEIGKVRSDLSAEVGQVKADLLTEMAVHKADVFKWMFGQTIVIIGAVVMVLRFMGHF